MAFLMLFLVQTYAFTSLDDKSKKKKTETVEKIHFSSKKLYHDIAIDPNGNILVGNVHITHGKMTLTCDSAVMYEKTNSFLAYGNVYLTDGDSVSIKGDSLTYANDFARMYARQSKDVVFKHGKMTLRAEHLLNYNRNNQVGFFDEGGMLEDPTGTLNALHGEYHMDTKDAIFTSNREFGAIVLKSKNNKRDQVTTYNLHYNTKTKWAHATGETNLYNGDNLVFTRNGYYNTSTGEARIMDGNRLTNSKKKSALSADTIHYDKRTKRTYAYGHVTFRDSINNTILLGDYGWYHEEKNEAMCTGHAVAKEFKNSEDTLFIHGDTLRLYTYNQKTDSAYRVLRSYYHVRAFRSDMQMVCDSLNFVTKDSCLTLYKDPIAWNDNRQIVGEEINIFLNDSTVDSVYIDRQAIMIEQLSDSTLYNQVAGRQMRAYFKDGNLYEFWVDGNGQVVNFPMEKDSTFLYLNYIEAPKFRAFLENKKLKKLLGFPKPEGTTYPLGMAPPERTKLPGFAWFDWIRPKDKYDIFIWRSKGDKNKLKEIPRRNAPMQTLQRLSNNAANKAEEKSSEIQEKTAKALDDAGLEVKVE